VGRRGRAGAGGSGRRAQGRGPRRRGEEERSKQKRGRGRDTLAPPPAWAPPVPGPAPPPPTLYFWLSSAACSWGRGGGGGGRSKGGQRGAALSRRGGGCAALLCLRWVPPLLQRGQTNPRAPAGNPSQPAPRAHVAPAQRRAAAGAGDVAHDVHLGAGGRRSGAKSRRPGGLDATRCCRGAACGGATAGRRERRLPVPHPALTPVVISRSSSGPKATLTASWKR
jgi:hypothetical protein